MILEAENKIIFGEDYVMNFSIQEDYVIVETENFIYLYKKDVFL